MEDQILDELVEAVVYTATLLDLAKFEAEVEALNMIIDEERARRQRELSLARERLAMKIS